MRAVTTERVLDVACVNQKCEKYGVKSGANITHLAEGIGVRKTARLTGVGRETVGRILHRAGGRFADAHWVACPRGRHL